MRWTQANAEAFVKIKQEAGATGAKISVPRVARKAGVSESFVRSLELHAAAGSRFIPNKEQSKVEAVLRAFGRAPDVLPDR